MKRPALAGFHQMELRDPKLCSLLQIDLRLPSGRCESQNEIVRYYNLLTIYEQTVLEEAQRIVEAAGKRGSGRPPHYMVALGRHVRLGCPACGHSTLCFLWRQQDIALISDRALCVEWY